MFGLRRVFAFLVLLGSLFVSFCTGVFGAEPGEMKTFDGLFGFGWIGADRQKELDMGATDFLVELRLKTEEVKRGNIAEIGLLAKKPLGNQPGYAVAMMPTNGTPV